MRASLPRLAGHVTKLKGIRPCPLPPPPPPPPPPTHPSTLPHATRLHELELNRSAWPNPIFPEFAFDSGFRSGAFGSNSQNDRPHTNWLQHVLVRTIDKNLQRSTTSRNRDRIFGIVWLLLPSLVVYLVTAIWVSDLALLDADKWNQRRLEVNVYGQRYRCWIESAHRAAETRRIERTKAEIQEASLHKRKQEEVRRQQGRLSLDMILQLYTLEATMQTC